MALVIKGDNAVDAWLQGCGHLSAEPSHALRNVITEIEDPILVEKEWYARYDPKAVDAADRLSVVAKVLFPDLPRKGEVLNLLEIWRGASFADVNQQTGFGEPGKGAPHGDENTCFAAHP